MAAPYSGTPTASCYLDGKRWYGARKLSYHQKFKEQIETGSVEGKDPPITPRIGMELRYAWGYDGVDVAGFTGVVTDTDIASYPYTEKLLCSGVLWLADQNNEVLQTDPLNSIKASDAAKYLLTHYGGIPASRLNLPVLPASGAAWDGSEWTLGILTPVQWGDVDQQSGGTTAMRAAAEIYGGLGYWLRANYGGVVIASQMERKPSTQAREVFAVDVNLLLKSPPHRQSNYANVFNQATVRGADTGVDGAQLYDQRRTSSPVLPSGANKDFAYSSTLLEYENATDAGAASVSSVTERILRVVSRVPDVLPPFAVKADPRRSVGDTVGVVNTALRLSTQKNFFIYELTRECDLDAGQFDDTISLDGGTGNSGVTTVPPPDASFSWTLMAETLDGDAVVEVALDGSGSTSPSGEIVSWAWSTSTPTYGSTPDTASGEHATLVFLASDSPADVTLIVTDTTSKTGTFEALIDLTGADTQPPLREVISVAAGSAWYVTPDGGATWNVETSNGDAIAVGTIGAGADDRAVGTGGTYGLLATRGSGGAGGLRQTLDTLASPSTNLVANSGALTSNIWVNEANPARVWFAIGSAVYRSLDGGATKVAMASAPDTVSWIMEDPDVENSVFLLAGSDMLNATDPSLGWALLYPGPASATARQFVRSRDGSVTWIAYTGAPAGEALQRVESGALADLAVTDIRSLALDRQASGLRATLYAVTADDPPQLWAFDGITGLSAVQSIQTFPAGATVQHILMSRLFDVIYCGDFDSIAPGQGAVRKYFPIPDQLLLWKALASGQQAHMLGLGSRASAPAEVLRMSNSVDPPGVWHYQSTRSVPWIFRALPVSGATPGGYAIAADTFNPDRWLAVFNTDSSACFSSGGKIIGDGWAYSPLWETEDAGGTWTEVLITPPPGWVDGSLLGAVGWSEQTGNSWVAPFGSGGTHYTAVVTGSGGAVTSILETTDYSAPNTVTGGADGDLIFVATFSAADGVRYLDTTLHTPAGSSPGDLTYGGADRLPNSRILYMADDTIYRTSDYRAAQPVSWLASVGARVVAVAAGALYYNQGGGDLVRITDPEGAATATTVVTAAGSSNVRVDRQTRTHAGCATGGGASIDDGATTVVLPAATDVGFLASNGNGRPNAFEIMVRS